MSTQLFVSRSRPRVRTVSVSALHVVATGVLALSLVASAAVNVVQARKTAAVSQCLSLSGEAMRNGDLVSSVRWQLGAEHAQRTGKCESWTETSFLTEDR